MLLNDLLISAGKFCKKNIAMQYIPYLFVVLVELEDLKSAIESIPFEVFCLLTAIFGIFVRIFAQISKEKNSFSNKGAYSIIRNPLFFGNFFILFAITLMTQSWEIILTNSMITICFYSLIALYEEDIFKEEYKQQYINYANKTNCFIPSLKNYINPDKNFNIKQIIKHESSTWLLCAVSFVTIEIIRGYFEFNKFFLSKFWFYVLIFAFIIWLYSLVFISYKKDKNENL